jgi:CRP-like cAMP-binding protein
MKRHDSLVLSYHEVQERLQKYFPVEEYDTILFPKGYTVFHENEPAEGLYILLKGSLKICVRKREGHEEIIRVIVPTAVIGYKHILSDLNFLTTAVTLVPVALKLIPKDIFLYLVKNNPDLMEAFLTLLSIDDVESEQQLINFEYKPVRGRLADALLRLEKLFNRSNGTIHLSRRELAGYIGSVRETTTRLISELREEHIIDTSNKEIKILDKEKLRKISNLY